MFEEKVLPVAWYKAEQWDDLLAASADRDDLEDTYFEWVQNWLKAEDTFSQQGMRMMKVEVDVPEMVAWCKTHNLAFDSTARSEFVAKTMKERAERRQ